MSRGGGRGRREGRKRKECFFYYFFEDFFGERRKRGKTRKGEGKRGKHESFFWGTGQTKGSGAPERALQGEKPRRRRGDAGRGENPHRASHNYGKEKKEKSFFLREASFFCLFFYI